MRSGRVVAIVAAVLSLGAGVRAGDGIATLSLGQTIALPGVHGRLDHMAISDRGMRLFVAALGNGSVEVVDLRGGRRVDSIAGLSEPQGVAALPGNRIIVTNGGSSTAAIYDARALTLLRNIPLRADPDNIRLDADAKHIYIGCGGYRDGALGVLDLDQLGAPHFIALPGHPESFQLEANGPRIFVNVPGAHEVTVVDPETGRAVAHWAIPDARGNFPMALDEGNGRLFIGCRDPARLLVLDISDGERVAEYPCVADSDDIFYDGRARRVYVSGGGGTISIFRQEDPDHYVQIDSVETRRGARTARFDPEHRRLCVAVPADGTKVAEIRAYRVE